MLTCAWLQMHDCAMTQSYFVVLAPPLLFQPEVGPAVAWSTLAQLRPASHAVCMVMTRMPCVLQAIAKGRLPFVFDKSEPLRFGLLPRMDADATNLRWFEFPPQVMFHTAAAFEDGDTVKLYACAFDEVCRPALLYVLHDETTCLSPFLYQRTCHP